MKTSLDAAYAAQPQRRVNVRWLDQLNAYAFLLPALLAFSLFAWYPIVRSLMLSFQDIGLAELRAGDIGLINPDYYIGFDNYERMQADPVFKSAWRNSYEFAGLSVLMGFFVPVLVAILVNEMRRARGFFRLVYFLPNVIPGVIGLLVWQQIYRIQGGYLNLLLRELGFEMQTWIQDPLLVKPSMLVIMTWGGFGATMLLYLASLQDLPVELYEAAEIDGAMAFDRVLHITLPHLRPTMVILLILQIIGVAQVFLEPFVLENWVGQSATTPVLTIYRKAFTNGDFGLASAWSVMLIVLLAGFSLIYLRISNVLERDDVIIARGAARVRWHFYPLFGLAVAALALLTNVLRNFLGQDAAATFVVLIGYVLLTYRLPRWIQLAVQAVMALAAAILLENLTGPTVTGLAIALIGVLWLHHRFDWDAPRLAGAIPALHGLNTPGAKAGLQLAALLLAFATLIALAGQTAGALLGVIVGGLLLATLKPGRALTRLTSAVLLLVLIVGVASLTSARFTLGALLALAFLLSYQPRLETWRGRGLYALAAAAIMAFALWLANGFSLSDDFNGRDLVTGLTFGFVGNFVLFSNPYGTRPGASWERGALSRLELRTWGGRALYRGVLLFLLMLSVTVIFPFVFAFTAGLKESNAIFRSGLVLWPDDPIWDTYEIAWERFDVLRLFRNTLVVVVNGTLIQVGVSLLAAYSLSRLKPRGGRTVMLGFLVTLMIPSIAYLVPLYVTVSKLPITGTNLLGSYWGIWLPYGVNAFAIFVLKNFFDGLPSELFDAAKVDGAGPLQILWRIVLPLSVPILIVLSILTFVNLWRDFLWPYLVLLRKTELQPISVYLYIQQTSDTIPMNIQMASYFLAMLPPLILAIALQRYMRQGLSIGAVKG